MAAVAQASALTATVIAPVNAGSPVSRRSLPSANGLRLVAPQRLAARSTSAKTLSGKRGLRVACEVTETAGEEMVALGPHLDHQLAYLTILCLLKR